MVDEPGSRKLNYRRPNKPNEPTGDDVERKALIAEKSARALDMMRGALKSVPIEALDTLSAKLKSGEALSEGDFAELKKVIQPLEHVMLLHASLEKAHGVEKRESGEFKELIRTEKEKLSKFFNRAIEVPALPAEVTKEKFEFWKQNGFELHYLPKMDMKALRGTLPNWKEPDLKYVGSMNETLEAGWLLIDGKQKPQYTDGTQKYENDSVLEAILPKNSRFNLTWSEIDDLRSEIAKALKANQKNLRLPRAIEFNIIGNIHHPEWGATDIYELFDDLHTDGWYRLSGGYSNGGGLSSVRGFDPAFGEDGRGFRPVVSLK